ncbi:hypothetical protein ACQCQ6_11090 [Ralstonia pseudosolanacearum]|uniref:hypothetical protein n=1 Tax=Ralstonia pseudosolanacearum TaxID=1310165 RepID=UPI001432DB75|nr:hypothetical protein [Ralstonia solanacearum]QKL90966.1 hypothetical protein HI802_01970 [Ralstonia solanacearum]QKL96043.1 hypothetical protein HI801_01970 [Ralstonia solanacearum]QLR09158.1 hypothetical protein H1A20_01955 [Ralstonia solanacearum]
MPKFEVYPTTNAGTRTGSSVFVNAADTRRAAAAGKYWLSVVGRRTRYVRAVPWYPERDMSMRGYVQRNPGKRV